MPFDLDPALIPYTIFALLVAYIAKLWFRSRETHGPAAHADEDIATMKTRLASLERIVTDQGYAVASQIEALRDTRLVEDQRAATPLGLDIRKEQI